ncbi:MAG: ATP-binding cassette domain-containing protein, partial [Kistimonas sp.]|nr:ATP-binding cassette domain-containing protein [Kistimonas sp.]
MFLLRFDDVTMAYGDQPLLENTSFQVDAGERLCLLGRNGTGKSTLLRLAAGQMAPDAGIVRKGADTTLAMLDQNLPSPAGLR